jgi:TPR repeat protein
MAEKWCLEADVHFFGHGTPQSYEHAIYFYNKARKLGSRKAFMSLGRMLLEGEGVERNIQEAKKMYIEVADYEPYANYCLGKMAEDGTDPDGDGKPDYITALDYYQRAKKLDSPVADAKIA